MANREGDNEKINRNTEMIKIDKEKTIGLKLFTLDVKHDVLG